MPKKEPGAGQEQGKSRVEAGAGQEQGRNRAGAELSRVKQSRAGAGQELGEELGMCRIGA